MIPRRRLCLRHLKRERKEKEEAERHEREMIEYELRIQAEREVILKKEEERKAREAREAEQAKQAEQANKRKKRKKKYVYVEETDSSEAEQ